MTVQWHNEHKTGTLPCFHCTDGQGLSTLPGGTEENNNKRQSKYGFETDALRIQVRRINVWATLIGQDPWRKKDYYKNVNVYVHQLMHLFISPREH